MRRVAIAERPDWRAVAEAAGFTFHHEGGQRYWDERAMYAFSLEEIERDIEGPSAELHAMCLDLVDEAVRSEALMERLAIAADGRDFVAGSWQAAARSV